MITAIPQFSFCTEQPLAAFLTYRKAADLLQFIRNYAKRSSFCIHRLARATCTDSESHSAAL